MTTLAEERAGQGTAGLASRPGLQAGDSDPATEVSEVGILFVHGMGKHQRGDFLRQMGEPLYQWVAAWLGRGDVNASHRTMRAEESSTTRSAC